MKNIYILILTILSTALVSCKPELDFDLEDYDQKLVVDGWIEQGRYPQVVLTRSSSYFEDVDSVSIRKFIVSTAKVTVSDGETSEVLTFKKNSDYFPPYIYQATSLKGIAGKQYTLKIDLEGKTYTATTSIPETASLDQLWFETLKENDTLGLIRGKFTDSEDQQNFYRTFTKRENKDVKFIPTYYSTIPDIYFNGKEFSFSLFRGSESLTDIKNDLYFVKGDTVTLKFCTMDKTHFEFWSTLENELYVTGNPFASSGNKVKSNISNNALGIWGGYGAKYYRIIAK